MACPVDLGALACVMRKIRGSNAWTAVARTGAGASVLLALLSASADVSSASLVEQLLAWKLLTTVTVGMLLLVLAAIWIMR